MAIAPRNVCLWPKADVSGDTPTPFLNTALGCYDPVRAGRYCWRRGFKK